MDGHPASGSWLDGLCSTTPRHDQRPAGLHDGCDCGGDARGPDPWRKGFTRRRMLQGSAALVAALGLQTVTTRFAFSADPALDTDAIVVINLRGGWDSLSVVVPTFEDTYYSQRPNIAVPKGAALPLERGFGLHPQLTGIHDLYQQGNFAPVVAVGTPDTTLSHFEAMDTLERGTATGVNSSGWLNRLLQARSQKGTFSAVQFGSQVPLALAGDAPALALSGLQSFGLAGYDDVKAKASAAFTSLYKSVKHPMAGQVKDTLSAVSTVEKLKAEAYTPAASYPNGGLSNALKDAARLIKADVGLTVATLDVGGWDMHTNEGTVSAGDLFSHMVELNGALTAFIKDIGDTFGDVTIMLVSEFGRTLRENGSIGTDHGHGQAMWVIGGGVKGGKVYGDWPGLAQDKLFVNGSLAAMTDYRDVIAGVLSARGAVGSFSTIFPDYKPTPLAIASAR